MAFGVGIMIERPVPLLTCFNPTDDITGSAYNGSSSLIEYCTSSCIRWQKAFHSDSDGKRHSWAYVGTPSSATFRSRDDFGLNDVRWEVSEKAK